MTLPRLFLAGLIGALLMQAPTLDAQDGRKWIDGVISGRVLDEDGRAIEGATVTYVPDDSGLRALSLLAYFEEGDRDQRGYLPVRSLPSTTTSEDGAFHVSGPRARHVEYEPEPYPLIVIEAAGFAALTVPCVLRDPLAVYELGDVRLEPSASLTGRIQDSKGRPLEGARVALVVDEPRSKWFRGVSASFQVTQSDAEGAFVLPSPPHGSFELMVDHPNAVPHRSREVSRAAEPVDVGGVVLQDGPTIRGFVRDEEGKGVSGAVVYVTEFEPPRNVRMQDALVSDFYTATRPWTGARYCTTSEDGSFERC